jgi:hypothetical protein
MSFATRDILDDRQRSPGHKMTQRADEPSDERLMTDLDGPGVEAALSKLYDRYGRTVFGVGLKILDDRSMAEELVENLRLRPRQLLNLALSGHAQRRIGPLPQACTQNSPGIRWAVARRCRKGSVCGSSRGRGRVLAVVAGLKGP